MRHDDRAVAFIQLKSLSSSAEKYSARKRIDKKIKNEIFSFTVQHCRQLQLLSCLCLPVKKNSISETQLTINKSLLFVFMHNLYLITYEYFVLMLRTVLF